ncbi:LuxR family transcriptional regulator, maltose regulon positive regulatory protein [Rhodococcus tukisamuensis]|uniref:LuxR family transcriptional regulator, maltose regulon positive regulatory protein n=1 Tax=Rhodococcus tukisamuensis TaxID=168276 RepID=A0A1G6U0N4_9NOCA|nr:LuxR family transcriptional regulator, maltose regulon positive regulatory protein [Rhodococcus tukisamuensis]
MFETFCGEVVRSGAGSVLVADPTVALRPRLFARLDEGRPLTVIGGPRGSGKSALVQSWLATPAAAHLHAVLVPAPATGLDPADYWRCVDEVLRRVDPSVGTAVVVDLPELLREEDHRTGILGLLRSWPGTRVIVTTRWGAGFADHWPAELEATVLVGAELSFTESETAEYFARSGVVLDERTYRSIHAAVGGHAGLVRSALAVARVFGADYEVERARSTDALDAAVDRYVADQFLGDAELAPLRPFLLSTSVAAVVTVAVATALTGDGARSHLLTLERSGVLVRAAGPQIDEWVYPPAVRTALVRAARAEHGGRSLPESAVLARHFQQSGDLPEALVHAVEAEQWDLALSIVGENWVEMIHTRPTVLRESLTALPPSVVEGFPTVKAARELFVRWGSDQVEVPYPGAAGPAGRTAGSRAPLSLRDTLILNTVQMMVLRFAGEFGRAVDLAVHTSALAAGTAAADRSEVDEILPLLRLQWSITRQLAGDLGESTTDLLRAYRTSELGGIEFAARNAAGALALNYALTGEYGLADQWLEAEARFGVPAGWVGPMVRVPGLVARALVGVGRLDTASAARALDQLDDLSDRDELWGFAVYARCRLDLARGAAEEGLDRVRRAVAVYGRWLRPGSVSGPLLVAVEAELRCALGRATEARAAVAGTYRSHPLVALARARVEFQTGNPGTAAVECEELAHRGDAWTGTRMEAVLLGSAASLALGEAEAAGRGWRRVAAFVEQTGAVGLLTTVPAAAVDALSAELPAPQAWRTLPAEERAAQFPDPVRRVSLTGREATVLRSMVDGATVAEIASRLYVSPNTVKTQLQSLYRKLGVHTRADAIRVARESGLA